MVLLVVFSILMPLTEFYIERFSPRCAIALSAMILGIGYIASSFAAKIASRVLTYGLVAGVGMGTVSGLPLAGVLESMSHGLSDIGYQHRP